MIKSNKGIRLNEMMDEILKMQEGNEQAALRPSRSLGDLR